jgi:hypothetical protein
MESSRPRPKARQRQRKRVAATVDRLPPRYVLEAVAQRLEITNGWLELRVKDGFVQYANRTRELSLDAGERPTGWTQADVDRYLEDQVEILRQYDTLTDFNPRRGLPRTIVSQDMFTADQLLEHEPKPTMKRMRDLRVEE